MDVSVKINEIVKQVTSLDYNSKIQMAEKILSLLKKQKKDDSSSVNLTHLKGLGAEMWNQIDVDSYLKNERSSSKI
jgi:hypothetical protein